MKPFRNILFVSSGTKDDVEALQQAIKLAHNNQAALEILMVCPEFPDSFEQYKTSYESFLKEQISKSIEAAKSDLPANHKKLLIPIDIEWGTSPDNIVIQHVLRQGHDLLIKSVEEGERAQGYKAMDMGLLRKCPCTLYLHRPLKHSKDIRIAVAVDPDNKDLSGQDLTLNLLKLAHSLAKHYKAELSIISCWNYVMENVLRSSAWMEIPQSRLDEMILHEGNESFLELDKLIQKSGMSKPTILHLKGSPTELIPQIVTEKSIDVLVMGTVARTGIAGFIIGNTAENILQKLDCSLWALKPLGFVSPVKAY
ncbi:MAG: universal stress protein [Legionella sp.]|nr:universal stress protein [Legionella sp.]